MVMNIEMAKRASARDGQQDVVGHRLGRSEGFRRRRSQLARSIRVSELGRERPAPIRRTSRYRSMESIATILARTQSPANHLRVTGGRCPDATHVHRDCDEEGS
jgi:hypothetical protein